MKPDFFKTLSIKTRVTLFMLGIFLLSLWLLMFYASRILHTDMQRLLSDQQFSTATFVAEEVNHELDDRLSALERLAKTLTPALLTNAASLQSSLDEHTFLLSLFNGGINVLSLDGVIISTTPPDPARLGVSYMDRDYVVSALKDGKTSIGRPVMGKVLKAPIFSMIVPIRDASGKVIGALMGVTNLGQPNFLDMIEKAAYGKTGGFLLVAPQYRLIVTATDKRRIMEEFPAPGVDPVIDARVGGKESTELFVNPLGVQVLSSAKNVPVAGWFVVASLPAEEAFAPIRDVERRLLLATLSLTLLAAGLTWWMVRRQLAPMLATVKSLAVMAQSDLHPAPLPVTRQDEIGKLIGGFNHLLAELGHRDEQVRQLAFYDPLTQLPNRRLLNDRMSQALAESKRNGRYGALMFLDLDNFKALNDTLGHAAGDLLLQQAATRMKSCVREVDTVARLGGDEFVVMLSDLDADKVKSTADASNIAEKIRVALAQPYQLTIKHDAQADTVAEHQCTASIGVVVFIDNEGTLDDFFRLADTAMYQAKDAGSNSIRLSKANSQS
ncbi:MAG TPA: GGDEF domain-containing protein [Rhodoferax sp.]